MNPLDWKREHQIALTVATLIGLAIGLAVGYARGGNIRGFWQWAMDSLKPGLLDVLG